MSVMSVQNLFMDYYSWNFSHVVGYGGDGVWCQTWMSIDSCLMTFDLFPVAAVSSFRVVLTDNRCCLLLVSLVQGPRFFTDVVFPTVTTSHSTLRSLLLHGKHCTDWAVDAAMLYFTLHQELELEKATLNSQLRESFYSDFWIKYSIKAFRNMSQRRTKLR